MGWRTGAQGGLGRSVCGAEPGLGSGGLETRSERTCSARRAAPPASAPTPPRSLSLWCEHFLFPKTPGGGRLSPSPLGEPLERLLKRVILSRIAWARAEYGSWEVETMFSSELSWITGVLCERARIILVQQVRLCPKQGGICLKTYFTSTILLGGRLNSNSVKHVIIL